MSSSKRNVGSIDRFLRVIIGILLAFIVMSNYVGGYANIALFAITVFFVYTGFAASCPIYGMFGLRTRNQKKESGDK